MELLKKGTMADLREVLRTKEFYKVMGEHMENLFYCKKNDRIYKIKYDYCGLPYADSFQIFNATARILPYNPKITIDFEQDLQNGFLIRV